jgi:predicted O-methyltransferase YrrM
MTASGILQKAARLPQVARDGWNYPALRLRARAQGAVEAVRDVGFDEGALRAFEREFEALAPSLYTRLHERASEAGDSQGAARLADPSPASVEGKKLLYVTARALRPEMVVETGPFNGASSTFILRALEENGSGRLVSFDRADAHDALGVPLSPGRRPGWLVPPELEERFELVLGDIRTTLRPRLACEPRLDFFFHDSLHTFRHMLFEFRAAWQRLASGGVLASDDVFWNPAFWLFATWHRVPLRHIGTAGLMRKP